MSVAEHKYNLALVETQTEKSVRQQPWYKERLHTKYVKALKPTDQSPHLVGKNWMFVKDGLDDFRDGMPPDVQGSDFIKMEMEKGAGPTLNKEGTFHQPLPVKQQAEPYRFTKRQICFSRATPLQQMRREHIDEIELGLLNHPLALYPHLEEAVPPEMFDDIVDILDPDMQLADEIGDRPEDLRKDSSELKTKSSKDLPTVDTPSLHSDVTHSTAGAGVGSKEDQGPVPRNPYRWLPRKEEIEREKRDHRAKHERALFSSLQDEHIRKVTREFCQWVADLGGETNNIEESTIASLFASGYETKPALSVPIHVVELTNVPPELRLSASFTAPPAQTPSMIIEQGTKARKDWRITQHDDPTWEKFKYGAWYLPPNTWEKRRWDDKMIDPMALKDQELSDAKKKSHHLNQELSTMHASKAFTEFISKKAARRPEFLREVEQLQRTAAEEERVRLAAEHAAKIKKPLTRSTTRLI